MFRDSYHHWQLDKEMPEVWECRMGKWITWKIRRSFHNAFLDTPYHELFSCTASRLTSSITSAKEVMISSAFVCLLAGLRRKINQFHKIRRKRWQTKRHKRPKNKRLDIGGNPVRIRILDFFLIGNVKRSSSFVRQQSEKKQAGELKAALADAWALRMLILFWSLYPIQSFISDNKSSGSIRRKTNSDVNDVVHRPICGRIVFKRSRSPTPLQACLRKRSIAALPRNHPRPTESFHQEMITLLTVWSSVLCFGFLLLCLFFFFFVCMKLTECNFSLRSGWATISPSI